MNDKKDIDYDKISREEDIKDRKLDNLINIVENYTRTERHLEQYSNIGNPQFKEKAREKQDLREKQMNELKSQLIKNEKDSPTKTQQIEDLKENYQFGENYKESNKEHMNAENLQNLEKKQENRKIQLENLEENRKEQ